MFFPFVLRFACISLVVLSLAPFVCGGIVYLARSLLSATSPTGGHDTLPFFFLYSFDLFFSLFLFLSCIECCIIVVSVISIQHDEKYCIVYSACCITIHRAVVV